MAVDYITDWPIATALSIASASAIVNFIYEEIVIHFLCPVEIVTDRGANLTSKILKQYMAKIKSHHIFTSAVYLRKN